MRKGGRRGLAPRASSHGCSDEIRAGAHWARYLHLEDEEVQADAEMAAQRKRPDAWAVSWEKWHLLILEFTRPNDRGELSLHETDLYKKARYKSLLDLLARLLPGWEVEVQTYTVGI